jgi:hypothetical protein
MLGYPLPLRSEFFAYQTTKSDAWRPLQAFRSWLHPPSEEMNSVCLHLQSRQWIWKYVPWIKSVYLCDEISFNWYHDDLPIKFFVVAQNNQLWFVKILFSAVSQLVSFITKARWKQRQRQLSTCVDENYQDFWPLVFSTSDPYLVYRLAHLVPYYHEDFTLQDSCIEKNYWLTYYLPNYQLRQTIFLPLDTLIWSTLYKKILTKLFSTWLFVAFNAFIYWFVSTFWKLRKKEHAAWTRIETVTYYITQIDKRKWYALERELAKK